MSEAVILVGWDVSNLTMNDIIEIARNIVVEDYTEDEVDEVMEEFISDYIKEDDRYGDEYSEEYKEALMDWLDEYFGSIVSLYSADFIGVDFGTSTKIGDVAETIKELNESTYGKYLTEATSEEPKMMVITV